MNKNSEQAKVLTDKELEGVSGGHAEGFYWLFRHDCGSIRAA